MWTAPIFSLRDLKKWEVGPKKVVGHLAGGVQHRYVCLHPHFKAPDHCPIPCAHLHHPGKPHASRQHCTVLQHAKQTQRRRSKTFLNAISDLLSKSVRGRHAWKVFSVNITIRHLSKHRAYTPSLPSKKLLSSRDSTVLLTYRLEVYMAYVFRHFIWHLFWHSFRHLFRHSIWHLFRHSIWHLFWHSILHLFRHSFPHSIWHLFWRSIWHSIWYLFRHSVWHSISHLFRHTFWHIFWHSFWHSIWHRFLAFFLAYILTFFLVSIETFLFDILSNVHSIWHSFWQSIQHAFWHSIWHSIWPSLWHFSLAWVRVQAPSTASKHATLSTHKKIIQWSWGWDVVKPHSLHCACIKLNWRVCCCSSCLFGTLLSVSFLHQKGTSWRLYFCCTLRSTSKNILDTCQYFGWFRGCVADLEVQGSDPLNL